MSAHKIPFNRPSMVGDELKYITEAVQSGKISGDGLFSKKCHAFFENRLGFKKVLLTTSCTDALEMSAILLDIKPGDEVIVPSYTFVSTVNAFLLRGAKVRFIDSTSLNPNLDADQLQELVTEKTRAIIPVHYAGIACDMEKIHSIADASNIAVVEDAAQALSAVYINKDGQHLALGTIGKFACFSFHETKNVISGEGGLLAVNDSDYAKRAEVIREKGTNRSAFFRGEVDKYGWVDIGSSFLPSDIIGAFLYAQLEKLDVIQQKRLSCWNTYYDLLKPLSEQGHLQVPQVPAYAIHNAHMFYIITKNEHDRDQLIAFLNSKGINAVFHYQSLHASKYFSHQHDGRALPWADYYSQRLLRLPLFYTLTNNEIEIVCNEIKNYYHSSH